MTSYDELLSTRDVPVVLDAPKQGFWLVVLAWLRTFAAATAQTVLTIAVLFGLLATVPAAFGQITTTVMSDSMEPGLHAGDVVVVRPMTVKQVKVGQVLLVHDPDTAGRLRLHRLQTVQNGELVLKGDANRVKDGTPVEPDKLLGAGWLRVPWIGLPIFWLRTGDLLPLGLALVALLAVAAVAGCDRPEEVRHRDLPTSRTRPARFPGLRRHMRRFLRLRSTQSAGALLLVLGVAVTSSVTHPEAAAAFNSVTTSPSNSLGTATFDCPSRPVGSASTVLYYSYMPASGSAEPDVSGSTPTVPGTLGSGATRVSGNCSGNASPYVNVDSSANGYIASNTSLTSQNQNFAISLWYKTASNSGVLASFGTTNTSTPTTAGDRQLYFVGNKVSFGIGRPGNPIGGCSINTIPSTNQWHLVVLSWTSGNTADLYLDNATTNCHATVNNLTTFASGYWRFGNDTPLDSSASNNYAGALDETAVYSAALSTAGVTAIYTAGH